MCNVNEVFSNIMINALKLMFSLNITSVLFLSFGHCNFLSDIFAVIHLHLSHMGLEYTPSTCRKIELLKAF